MLKLLRNTRRNMLNNGDVSKYLKYAVGEIVLVVVGILIALSINNCNADKANRKAELQLYQNIRTQINEDKEVVKGVMAYNDTYLKQYAYANQIIQNNDKNLIDTLKQIALNLYRYSDYNRSSNIYQTTINSGQLKIMKNTKIMKALQELEESYIYMNRMEELHFKVILQWVGPGIMDNINISTGTIERPDELYGFSIQNLFISFKGVMDEKNQIYQKTLEITDRITELIDKEVKT